jgi:tyrosyl-tRNA synthetase
MMAPELAPLLRRGVVEIIVEEELVGLLESGKPLRLKQGFDPSRPDIHLGHVVGLKKLRQFQELGHQLVLIVGDWTAQIGDPSGRSATRQMLSAEEVRANAETYMQQFFKVVDREKTEVRWQSEWFGDFGLSDVVNLTSRFTVAQMLAREDFSKRYAAGHPIAITEFLYPLLTAYDSVVVESDVEFGGVDQKFNCLVGRELQQMVGQRPQQVFLMPLLVGTDGTQKMSKSLDNYIGIDEPPQDIYGKVMSIPDDLIMPYFELVTDVADEELSEFKQQLDAQSINPMVLKKRLAREIVTQFQKQGVPEEMPEYPLPMAGSVSVRDLEVILVQSGTVDSRGEAKRLIAQNAVEVDGNKLSGDTVDFSPGTVIKVGKRRFLRLVKAE